MILVITIGLLVVIHILAIVLFEARMVKFIFEQHKKTRKETQEIKTRLTQVRKDLNLIEKIVKK